VGDDVEVVDDFLAPERWVTHEQMRDRLTELSEATGIYEGIPVPLGEDHPLRLRPGHPMEKLFSQVDAGVTEDGEPIVASPREDGSRPEIRVCRQDQVREDERVVNVWVDHKRNRRVYVMDKGGRRSALVEPLAPDRSMERFTLWLTTIGASDAWTVDAEVKAMELLQSMTTERQFAHYMLTGSFLESSSRSGLTYLFRRLRPTVAMSPRNKTGRDYMRVLAVLCLHPIGYYENSWGGCMVPTDDVIAHLTMMRGDEAEFWGQAVQHEPHEPEAGL
jgi:hypothetical protein